MGFGQSHEPAPFTPDTIVDQQQCDGEDKKSAAASSAGYPTSTVSSAISKSPVKRQSALDCKTFLRENKGSVTDYYRKIGELGEGAFGDVWLASQRVCAGTAEEHQGRTVAVKRIRKPNSAAGLDHEDADSEEAVEDFRAEVELMKALDHPSICRLLEVFEDAKNLYLVMEHIKGGELFDRVADMGNFSESDASSVMHQVASALKYCHTRSVIHRDIKPENIMVIDDENSEAEEGPTIKLIDFGFGCQILSGVRLRAKVGTFVYTAPETFKDEPPESKLDLWALGCVLYVLLSGNAPFAGPSAKACILSEKYSLEDEAWSSISEDAKSLIRGLLTVDPSKRLSAADVLQHPWIVQSTSGEASRTATARKSLKGQLKSLRRFHKRGVFHHLCAGVLARQMDESSLHELHCAFTEMDKDGDGVVSLEEFKRGIGELEATGDFSESLDEVFATIDMDGSDHIDYTEFLAACVDKKIEDQESVMWSAFEVFDANRDGKISFAEVEQMLDQNGSLKDAMSADAKARVWTRLKERCQSDGEIDFDHFLLAVRDTRASKPAQATSKEATTASKPAAQSEKPSLGLPIASKHPGKTEGGMPALPIAGRNQGAMAAMGLPVAKRGGGGLPIASRSGGPGLPIASRGS